jgi:DNA-directed RNA polymerase specialized sigma24 family protein
MTTTIGLDVWSEVYGLEPLVRRYLARRCPNRADLDDAVQDTLLRAARFRLKGHSPRRAEAWMLRIAANTIHDRARREARARIEREDGVALEDLACRASDGDAGSEGWVVGERCVPKDLALRVLDGAMASMRADDRALIGDYYGRTSAERGRMRTLEPDYPRAKMRLYRARRRLLRELERRLARGAGLASERVHAGALP